MWVPVGGGGPGRLRPRPLCREHRPVWSRKPPSVTLLKYVNAGKLFCREPPGRFGPAASSDGLTGGKLCSHSGSFASVSDWGGSAYIVWKCGPSGNILTPAD